MKLAVYISLRLHIMSVEGSLVFYGPVYVWMGVSLYLSDIVGVCVCLCVCVFVCVCVRV